MKLTCLQDLKYSLSRNSGWIAWSLTSSDNTRHRKTPNLATPVGVCKQASRGKFLLTIFGSKNKFKIPVR